MISYHGHSIVGSWSHKEKWRYRPRRNSELNPNMWWQTPCSIENLRTFIADNTASVEDRLKAAYRLMELVKEPHHVLAALRYKNIADRIKEDELHCDVVEKPDILEMMAGKEIERPLEYLREYCTGGYTPFSQQLIGADFILKMKKCGILYDMRVGKTLTATIALKYALANGLIEHGLVVCPRILMESVWANELQKEGLSVYMLDNGSKIDDATLSHADADVYIMSYETLVNRLPYINLHLDPSELMVICDESSRIKNPTAKRTKAVHALTYHTPYVVMLTGTPMEQGPQDIWSQMFAIDRGARLYPTFGTFAARYTYQVGNKYFINPHMQIALELAIAGQALRYVRSEADQFAGKDKNFRWVQLAPTSEQAHATEMAIKGFVQTLSGDMHELNAHVLTLYGFLREICCGYNKVRLDELSPYSRFRFAYDAKTLWLEAWLESNPGQPAVVFFEWDEHEQIVADMLDDINVPYVWMKRDSKASGLAECVRMFQEGYVRVILMKTTQAEGITLNRVPAVKKGLGTYPSIVYMSPGWSLGRFQQSQDRCIGVDPISKTNLMTPIYCLITRGSIEEKIMKALRGKKNVAETILKDTERQGFHSFVDELMLDPKDAAGDMAFDAKEMWARKIIGLSPELKPTHKRINKLCPLLTWSRFAVEVDTKELHSQTKESQRVHAARYLMDKYDEDGVLMKPNEKEQPEYSTDDDIEQEVS